MLGRKEFNTRRKKTRNFKRTNENETMMQMSLRGPECVFARARSRGLSRSQPVFVIIMLEKCMNICFINASYFISFYRNETSRELANPL